MNYWEARPENLDIEAEAHFLVDTCQCTIWDPWGKVSFMLVKAPTRTMNRGFRERLWSNIIGVIKFAWTPRVVDFSVPRLPSSVSVNISTDILKSLMHQWVAQALCIASTRRDRLSFLL